MNLKKVLGKHYERLRKEAIIKSVIFGLLFGFSLTGAISLLFWIIGKGSLLIGVLAAAVLGAVLGVFLYFKRYRPTYKNVARRLDRLGLDERIITMLELSGEDTDIALVQRNDAMRVLEDTPAERIKFRISALLSALLTASALIGVCFSSLFLLAEGGRMPYGKDLFAEGVDGSFEVVYTVSGGGYIRGETEQSIDYGESGSTVRAIAENGWMFVSWSDGESYPERREKNVKADAEIKAIFKRIDSSSPDEEDSDEADDLPYGSVIEEGGGGSSDELGGDNVKDDGEGSGGGKWQDRNQFIDGATYYRDYLEFYYMYATGIFEGSTDIPEEIIEFFETYFNGI